jgi:hypothetical protein
MALGGVGGSAGVGRYDADDAAAAAARPDNRASSLGAAALHAASPGSTIGSAPILIQGKHLTADHGGALQVESS